MFKFSVNVDREGGDDSTSPKAGTGPEQPTKSSCLFQS